MADILQQLRGFYADLEPARRRTLGAAGGLALALIVGVGVWASQPQYVPLTTPADVDESADITGALSRASIPWRIGRGGDTIEVLAEDATRARSAAASEHGIVGLEGLEQIDPWATPFVELLQKQRMLQGEIVRTINHMDGVARSACILNLPTPSDFIGRASHATAAVSVSPDPGATISRETARSVAEFVSHAVAGMSADDVSVVDTSTGRTLWSGAAEVAANQASDGQEGRREAELTAKLNSVLLSLFGTPDNYTVAVKLEISTASTESTVNSVDPDSAAPTTEHSESEQNGVSTAGASPGVDANLPERGGAGGAAASTSRSRERQETTYQYTRTQTTKSQPAGELKRLSASVVVNSEALAALAKGGTVDEAAEKTRLEAIMRAALGADTERGDVVVVEISPFAQHTLADPDVEATASVAETWSQWAPAAIALLTVLLVLGFGVRPLLKAATARSAAATPGRGTVPETADAAAGGSDGDIDEDGVVVDLSSRLRRHVEGYKPLSAERVSQLVSEQTDHSAEVLRRWMRS